LGLARFVETRGDARADDDEVRSASSGDFGRLRKRSASLERG
jgi:hypothetical protein